MRCSISLRVIGLGLSALICSGAQAEPRPFSLYGLAGWEQQKFLRHAPTEYRPVLDHNVQVIEARCDNSASGMIWRDRIDLKDTPILAWRWKIEGVYAGLDERRKSGDDFPARVYAVRSGGVMWWRTKAVVYVWSNGESGLEDWPDAYTDSAHVVAVRAGNEGVGEWQSEKRDLRADFKKYFGLDLETLDGVALMTDCDDHHAKARAWYGDLRLLKQ